MKRFCRTLLFGVVLNSSQNLTILSGLASGPVGASAMSGSQVGLSGKQTGAGQLFACRKQCCVSQEEIVLVRQEDMC